MPSIPPVGPLQVCICRSKAIHGVIWTDEKATGRSALCMLYYRDRTQISSSRFQATVAMYIWMTMGMAFFILPDKMHVEGYLWSSTFRSIFMMIETRSNFSVEETQAFKHHRPNTSGH